MGKQAHQAMTQPLGLYTVQCKPHGPAGRMKWAHVDQGDLPNRKFGEVGDVICGGFICSTRSKKERWAGFRPRGNSDVNMWMGNGRSRPAVYLPEASRAGERVGLPHSHYDKVGARLTGGVTMGKARGPKMSRRRAAYPAWRPERKRRPRSADWGIVSDPQLHQNLDLGENNMKDQRNNRGAASNMSSRNVIGQ